MIIQFSLSRNKDYGIDIKELESMEYIMDVTIIWIITELKVKHDGLPQGTLRKEGGQEECVK